MTAQRADYRIIPLPKSVQEDTTQAFTLQQGMAIAYESNNPELTRNAQFLCQWVEELTGLKLQLSPGDKKAPVRLALDLRKDT